MLNSVFESLFGCAHKRTTFPITPKRPSVRPGAYVACLDCGKEFAYNWNQMRLEDPVPLPAQPVTTSPMARPIQGLSRILRLGS
jgi:hypothetical protein